MGVDNFNSNDIESEDMDYILQVISNRIRRKVIRVLMREEALTYSALMKRVGIDDSGTFGFHLRKMQRLLRKNDMGEYMLNDLGKKAYDILENLTRGEARKVEEAIETPKKVEVEDEFGRVREPVTEIISNKLRFNLTQEIAESFKSKGKRLFISDLVKLVIYPMPRELFEEVVEGIEDCISVYAPSDLIDIVNLKCRDVFNVKSYKDVPRGYIYQSFGNMIDNFVSDILSKVFYATSSFTSKLFDTELSKSFYKEEVLHYDERLNIPQGSRLIIDSSGGMMKVKEGDEARIKVWKVGHKDPEVDFDISDSNVTVSVESGKCELTVPRGVLGSIRCDMSGGIVTLNGSNLGSVYIDLSGGMVKCRLYSDRDFKMFIDTSGGILQGNIELKRFEGKSVINCSSSGGGTRLNIMIDENTKLFSESKVHGGLAVVKLDSKVLPRRFMEGGFEESSSNLALFNEIMGGIVSIDVRR